MRHHAARRFVVFLLTLGADERRARASCTASLPRRRARVELAVLVAAALVATVTRYVALRTWVFARARAARGAAAEASC